MKLRFVLQRDCPSLACIDKHANCYLNPRKLEEFLETSGSFRNSNLSGLLLHEALHCIRQHAERAPRHSPSAHTKMVHHKWNIACDLECNDSIDELNNFPEKFAGLVPTDFGLTNDLLAEEYYELLSDDDIELIDFEDQGSGVFGEVRAWEAVGDLANGDLQSHLIRVNHISDFERSALCRRTLSDMAEYKCTHGTLPEFARRFVQQCNSRSKIDWLHQLRRCIGRTLMQSTKGNEQYTYHRPSRRASFSAPLLMPCKRGRSIPRIDVIVDVSGSVDSHQLAIAVREIAAIGQSLNSSVQVMACDTIIRSRVAIPAGISHRETQTLLSKHLIGGGGTDMVAGIESLLGMRTLTELDESSENNTSQCPDCIVVLTDGHTVFPKRRYSVPVIWSIFENGVKELPTPWKQSDLVLIGDNR